MPPTLISRNPPVCSCVTTNALFQVCTSKTHLMGENMLIKAGARQGQGRRGVGEGGGKVMNFSRGVLRIRS